MSELKVISHGFTLSTTNTTVAQATLEFNAEKVADTAIRVHIINGMTTSPYSFTLSDLNAEKSVGTIANGEGSFLLFKDNNLPNVYHISFNGYVVNNSRGTVKNAIIATIIGELSA